MARGPSQEGENISILEKLIIKNGPQSAIPFSMAFDMIIAGIDTTGNALAFNLYLLATNPEKQEILRQEVRQQMDSANGRITESGLAKMRYLKAVIREQARIHPVVNGSSRYTIEDVNLGGYHVPADTFFLWNLEIMGRDESLFDRPKE